MEPTIIFEDGDLLVINKPAGMTVNRADTTGGEETVQDWLERKFPISNFQFPIDSESDFIKRAGIVHRLDKETSGALLIAKNPESFAHLQAQFKERVVKKKYTALVHGEVKPQEGEINVPVGRLPWNRMRFGIVPGGRESLTKYHVLRIMYHVLGESKERLTFLELQPLTGRTHQIRVHLKYLGHPIVSDELYAGRKQARSDRKWCKRLFLHASEIEFRHPKTKKLLTFKAKLSEELDSVLKSLQ